MNIYIIFIYIYTENIGHDFRIKLLYFIIYINLIRLYIYFLIYYYGNPDILPEKIKNIK